MPAQRRGSFGSQGSGNSSVSGLPRGFSITASSTKFYSQCVRSGISFGDAKNALIESRNWYFKWWRQEQFRLPRADSNDIVLNIDEKKTDDVSSSGMSDLLEDAPLKALLLQSLKKTGGDVTDEDFLKLLDKAQKSYASLDTSATSTNLEGDEETELEKHLGEWMSLNKPHFQDCLGRHPETGEYMYTLGRMSFDILPEKHLKCAIRGTFVLTEEVDEEDIENGDVIMPSSLDPSQLQGLMTYDVSAVFHIEEPDLEAILTNFGYMLPHPEIPNRFYVWFTKGVLREMENLDGYDSDDDANVDDIPEFEPSDQWRETFGCIKRSVSERAKLLAARVLLSIHAPYTMEEDGSMEYSMNKPILAYVDCIYMDDNLRVLKGQYGTLYVLYRSS